MNIMKGNYLLPHSYRKFGWVLFLITLVAGIVLVASDYELEWPQFHTLAIYTDEILGSGSWFQIMETDLGDELISIGLIIGGILVGFSKERIEDEFIASIRLKSLVWATYVNYSVLLFATAFIYGMGFFNVMVFNMFTLLVIFIIKYQWSLYRFRKSYANEE